MCPCSGLEDIPALVDISYRTGFHVMELEGQEAGPTITSQQSPNHSACQSGTALTMDCCARKALRGSIRQTHQTHEKRGARNSACAVVEPRPEVNGRQAGNDESICNCREPQAPETYIARCTSQDTDRAVGQIRHGLMRMCPSSAARCALAGPRWAAHVFASAADSLARLGRSHQPDIKNPGGRLGVATAVVRRCPRWPIRGNR